MRKQKVSALSKTEIHKAPKTQLQQWCKELGLAVDGGVKELKNRVLAWQAGHEAGKKASKPKAKKKEKSAFVKAAKANKMSKKELASLATDLMGVMERERVQYTMRQASLMGQLKYVLKEWHKRRRKG